MCAGCNYATLPYIFNVLYCSFVCNSTVPSRALPRHHFRASRQLFVCVSVVSRSHTLHEKTYCIVVLYSKVHYNKVSSHVTTFAIIASCLYVCQLSLLLIHVQMTYCTIHLYVSWIQYQVCTVLISKEHVPCQFYAVIFPTLAHNYFPRPLHNILLVPQQQHHYCFHQHPLPWRRRHSISINSCHHSLSTRVSIQ